jgi:hypothetical protein
LATAQTLSAWVAPAAPQALENRGPRFPDSPNISWPDATQLRGCIVPLLIVKWHKPARFSDEQSMMQYAFKCLRGVALGKILPHTWEDGTLGLGDLPGCINTWKQLVGTPTKWQLRIGQCGTWTKTSTRSRSTMLGLKLLLLIWIGILQLSCMPSGWCYLRESISQFRTHQHNVTWLKVITQRHSYSEQPHRSFQKLPDAPEQAESNTMCFSGALRGTFRCSSMLLKLQNRIQEYSTEYEVIFRML